MDAQAEQKWLHALGQAEAFAAKENYIDAVGRARRVCDEMEAQIEGGDESPRLRALHLRAGEMLTGFETSFREWNGKIAARRQEGIAGAAEEMKRPLPNLPLPGRE